MLLITEIMFTVWISIKTDTGHIFFISSVYLSSFNLIILSPYVLDLILK